MAESQEQVDYTNLLLAELERALSPARLAPYMRIAGHDRKFAIQLYLWNARLSKAFLFPLNVAEVTVRNAIHHALTTHYGSADWIFNPPFQQTPQSVRSHQTAHARLLAGRRAGAPPVTADDLVAALNFDFWSNLFRWEYDALWTLPGLLNATFPNLPAAETRVDVQNRVQKVNAFRNRIAHHEPIHRARHRDYHGAILDLIGLISTETADWVKACSTVMAVVRTPPTPATGIHGLPLASTSLRPPPTLGPDASLATLVDRLRAARPPIVLTTTVPEAVISMDMVTDYIAIRAAEDAGLVDLTTETVSDVLARTTPLRTVDIDINQSTGDLQAMFFPPNVPQNQRPQVAIVRRAGNTAGAILHPGLRYR